MIKFILQEPLSHTNIQDLIGMLDTNLVIDIFSQILSPTSLLKITLVPLSMIDKVIELYNLLKKMMLLLQ